MEQTTSSKRPIAVINAIPPTDSLKAKKEERKVNPAFMIRKHLAEIYLRLNQLEARIEKHILATNQKTDALDLTKLSVQEFREFIDLLSDTLTDALQTTTAVTAEGFTPETPSKNENIQRETATKQNIGLQQIQGSETTTASLYPTHFGSKTHHRNFILARADEVFAKSDEVTAFIGDVEIPSGTTISKNIAVKGALRIGNKCRIYGKLEALKDITVGADTIINGDLVSRGNVLMGPRSLITGSVEASGVFEIEENAVVEGICTQTPSSK